MRGSQQVLAESWGFEPQIGFESYTRLAGEHLQPLGQLSMRVIQHHTPHGGCISRAMCKETRD